LAASFSGYLAQSFGLQWAFLGLSGMAFILIVFTYFLLKVDGLVKIKIGMAK
jgi:hypothetical protein